MHPSRLGSVPCVPFISWLLGALLAGSAAAEPITAFGDVESRQRNRGSEPAGFVVVGETAYFAATDDRHGRELWRTDGSTAGTRRVADICPGRCDSRLAGLVGAGDRLFFVADDGVTGFELWTSDGTPSGTRQVVDLCPGRCSSATGELVALRDRVLFAARAPALGAYPEPIQPWISDGTAAGTGRLCETCSLYSNGLTPFGLEAGGLAFFVASTADEGAELWSSDGTPEGTGVVVDLCPGTCSAQPIRLLHAYAGKLFFYADTFAEGGALWSSDGTAAGTRLFSELVPGRSGVALDTALEHRGLLYVAGGSFGAAVCGGRERCVWKTDGTVAGTVVAEELLPALEPSAPLEMLSAGPYLYYARSTGPLHDLAVELWVDDGGEQRRLLEGQAYIVPLVGLPDGRLVFAGDGSPAGIWVSDGSAAGTRRIAGLEPTHGYSAGESRGAVVRGEALFSAGRRAFDGEPWLSDGTEAGTRQLRELRRRHAVTDPRDLFALDDRVLFLAGEPLGSDLWASDGSAAGTEIVLEGAGGAGYAPLGDRVLVGDRFGSGKLWTTDGTAAGTAEVPGVVAPGPELVPFAGGVYFAAGFQGQQLWRSEGTADTTRLVHDLQPGYSPGGPAGGEPVPAGALPRFLTVAGDALFMVGLGADGAAELWRSDGTSTGTVLVQAFERDPVYDPLGDVDLGACGLLERAALGRRLLFAAYTAAEGCELWASDGTAAPPRLLADLAAGPASSRPAHFTAANGKLYFTVRGHGNGDQLWRTNGTVAGTRRVARLAAAGEASSTVRMIAAGGRLFLSVWSPSTGAELWVSDGTRSGTRRVVDLFRGPRGSAPGELLPLPDGRVLFAASDRSHGRELWVSDGTAAGTLRVEDLEPGAGGSSPEGPTLFRDRVLFAADQGPGRRLFAVDLADLPAPPASDTLSP